MRSLHYLRIIVSFILSGFIINITINNLMYILRLAVKYILDLDISKQNNFNI